MSTPTPRTKPIDLSKCKVGQRVKLRNGENAIFKGKSGMVRYPFQYRDKTSAVRSVTNEGLVWDHRECPLDIVAILPLPKKAGKKASGMPAEKPLKMTKRERELHNGQINKVIEQLKGLLKP